MVEENDRDRIKKNVEKSWEKYEVPGLMPNIASPWINADDSTDTSSTLFDNI